MSPHFKSVIISGQQFAFDSFMINIFYESFFLMGISKSRLGFLERRKTARDRSIQDVCEHFKLVCNTARSS